MKQSKSIRLKSYLLPGLFATLAIWGSHSAFSHWGHDPSPKHAALVARARAIFQYDIAHPAALSFNELASLSIALRFRDDAGAERLVSLLEQDLAFARAQ